MKAISKQAGKGLKGSTTEALSGKEIISWLQKKNHLCNYIAYIYLSGIQKIIKKIPKPVKKMLNLEYIAVKIAKYSHFRQIVQFTKNSS